MVSLGQEFRNILARYFLLGASYSQDIIWDAVTKSLTRDRASDSKMAHAQLIGSGQQPAVPHLAALPTSLLECPPDTASDFTPRRL